MKLKSRELTKSALDYAVSMVFNIPVHLCSDGNEYPNIVRYKKQPHLLHGPNFNPSTSWHIGGEYIDYAGVEFGKIDTGYVARAGEACAIFGETHLISAMRAIVLDCYGEEVDIPDELVGK